MTRRRLGKTKKENSLLVFGQRTSFLANYLLALPWMTRVRCEAPKCTVNYAMCKMYSSLTLSLSLPLSLSLSLSLSLALFLLFSYPRRCAVLLPVRAHAHSHVRSRTCDYVNGVQGVAGKCTRMLDASPGMTKVAFRLHLASYNIRVRPRFFQEKSVSKFRRFSSKTQR